MKRRCQPIQRLVSRLLAPDDSAPPGASASTTPLGVSQAIRESQCWRMLEPQVRSTTLKTVEHASGRPNTGTHAAVERSARHPGSPIPSAAPPAPTSAELTDQLHAAIDIRELWEVTCRLVHELVDADFVCLCLRPFELLLGRIFRDRHAFQSVEELLRFDQLSVLQPYVLAHPGLETIRLRDVISDVDSAST